MIHLSIPFLLLSFALNSVDTFTRLRIQPVPNDSTGLVAFSSIRHVQLVKMII